MCAYVCPRLIRLPLFPLRISCIIYGTLMNMLISQRAGRGERASPVLFLHPSDERGNERVMEKREGEEERLGEGVLLWVQMEESGRQASREGKRWKKRVWKYIYEIPAVRQARIVAIRTVASPCLCYIVLETNESPMLGGAWRGEIGIGSERERDERGK